MWSWPNLETISAHIAGGKSSCGGLCGHSHGRDKAGFWTHHQRYTTGAGPEVEDFLGGHTRWQEKHMLSSECSLGKSPQRFLSRGEGTWVPLTLYHSLQPDLGQTSPGRDLPQRQSGSQAAAQTPQFLQPQHPSPQQQPSTRCERKTVEEGVLLWAASRQSHGCLYEWWIGFLWSHGPQLFQNSIPWGQSRPSRAIGLYQIQPSGILLQQLERRPRPQ